MTTFLLNRVILEEKHQNSYINNLVTEQKDLTQDEINKVNVFLKFLLLRILKVKLMLFMQKVILLLLKLIKMLLFGALEINLS